MKVSFSIIAITLLALAMTGCSQLRVGHTIVTVDHGARVPQDVRSD